jgi:hypothetical protein
MSVQTGSRCVSGLRSELPSIPAVGDVLDSVPPIRAALWGPRPQLPASRVREFQPTAEPGRPLAVMSPHGWSAMLILRRPRTAGTGELMRIEPGMTVDSRNGKFGTLADVVVDPVRRRVTHLVVQPSRWWQEPRPIAVEAMTVCEGMDVGVVRVFCLAKLSGHRRTVERPVLRSKRSRRQRRAACRPCGHRPQSPMDTP